MSGTRQSCASRHLDAQPVCSPSHSLPSLLPCSSAAVRFLKKCLQEICTVQNLFSFTLQRLPVFSLKPLCSAYQWAAGALIYFQLCLKSLLYWVFMHTCTSLYKRDQWLKPRLPPSTGVCCLCSTPSGICPAQPRGEGPHRQV